MSTFNDHKYCVSLTSYARIPTRTVWVGNIPMGSQHPIRIQSMIAVPTMDTKACVEEIIQLADAGCDYARLTTQNLREAKNLKEIKQSLRNKGYKIPLIADVHFNPVIAETAARIVEKVRINPGNYVDKKTGKTDYSHNDYYRGTNKIREHLSALVNICKKHGTALRIGTNHGSLSDRIMSRYGDTPRGMVESAMEYLRICRSLDFHNIVLSMKSSNTRIMVQSTRLLVNQMLKEGMDYPLHLGVTEAGEGEDGRIKSAVGIGALLEDGIGDTIRVSLTEDPVYEIPVAKMLIERYHKRAQTYTDTPDEKIYFNPFSYQRRISNKVKNIGSNQVPVVFTSNPQKIDAFSGISFILVKNDQLSDNLINKLKENPLSVLIIESSQPHGIIDFRQLFFKLADHNCNAPVIIKRSYADLGKERLIVHSAADFGGMFIDGLGDGIWIETEGKHEQSFIESLSLGILQASRTRFSKTEYIACPSCGRTLFNIQETLKRVREKTGHLKNLKIGVMGCVVNGPGEMADADYGYVGSGPGKITLYKGKNIVRKNITEEKAVDELIRLIKENDDWQ